MQCARRCVPGPGEALPEPEIYARLVEAMGLFGEPPAELHELAPRALEPAGAGAFLCGCAAARARAKPAHRQGAHAVLGYRTLGQHLPAPSLAAVWLQSDLNAMLRTDSVLRTLGEAWREKGPLEIGAEIFRRILAHPEGVEIARAGSGHAISRTTSASTIGGSASRPSR